MEKIVITEEQDKVIKHHLYNFADKQVHCLGLIERDTELDLVTIARIVKGELYEIKREFQIGDIVKHDSTGLVYFVYSKGEYFIGCTELEGEHGQKVYSMIAKKLTLISKKENREDLKGEQNV